MVSCFASIVWYLLFVVSGWLCVVCRLLSLMSCGDLVVVYCSFVPVHGLSIEVRCSLFVVCRLSFTVRCLLLLDCCPLCVVCFCLFFCCAFIRDLVLITCCSLLLFVACSVVEP